MSILEPAAIFYDKVINIRLEKRTTETDATGFASYLYENRIEIGSWYDSDSLLDAATSLVSNNMIPKPNIRVSMDLLPGNNAFSIKVVVTNLANITDITDYCNMSVQMGYMMASKTNPTASNLRTFDSIVFTSYQSSPNPDGETVFDGVIVGKWYDIVSNNPVQFIFYPINVPLVDEDGNVQVDADGKKLTKKECLIGLEDFLTMIANAKVYSSKYFAGDGEGNYAKGKVSKGEYDKKSKGFTEMQETTSDSIPIIQYMLDPPDSEKYPESKYPEMYENGQPKDYVIDIYGMQTSADMTYISLIKSASDIIKTQMESRYGIVTHLILFDNALTLIGAENFSKGFQKFPVVTIDHIYSCSFTGPLLKLEAPYNPNVVPGSLIRVYPEYWNGAEVNNLMGEVRQAAALVGDSDPIYVYSILTMHIDFGTYEGNTMDILAVPITLTEKASGILTSQGQLALSVYQEEMSNQWEGEDAIQTYLIYGDAQAKDSDVTDIQSHGGSSLYGNKAYYYQVKPGENILTIASLRMGWEKLVWKPYLDSNKNPPAKYVSKVYKGGSIMWRTYINGEASPDIPFSALWPMILLSTIQFYDDSSSNMPIGITVADSDYDNINTPISAIMYKFLWLPLELNESNVSDSIGVSDSIDMFEKCAKWAYRKFKEGNELFSAEDIKDLINATLFLGGSINNIMGG